MLKFLRRIHKKTMVFGIMCLYFAFSTADYNTIMREDISSSVGILTGLGFLFFVPTIIILVSEYFEDRGNHNVFHR